MSFFTDQVILINKPLTWTSFDVVKKVKGLFKIKKIGHAGTLDPLADGLLILAIGKMTKSIDAIQNMEKEYKTTICLGATTPTLDREMFPTEFTDTSSISLEQIQAAITQHFSGAIQQTPPQYSAAKVEGKRAYALARAGKEAKLEPKTVEIKQFTVENLRRVTPAELPGANDITQNTPQLTLIDATIVCSRGTYVRVLADDLARKLGTRGYITSLTRNRIGEYLLEKAETLESLEKQKDLLHL